MIRTVAAVVALALVAGVTAVLGLDAAARAWGNPAAAVLIALAGVYLLCAITLTAVLTRKARP